MQIQNVLPSSLKSSNPAPRFSSMTGALRAEDFAVIDAASANPTSDLLRPVRELVLRVTGNLLPNDALRELLKRLTTPIEIREKTPAVPDSSRFAIQRGHIKAYPKHSSAESLVFLDSHDGFSGKRRGDWLNIIESRDKSLNGITDKNWVPVSNFFSNNMHPPKGDVDKRLAVIGQLAEWGFIEVQGDNLGVTEHGSIIGEIKHVSLTGFGREMLARYNRPD